MNRIVILFLLCLSRVAVSQEPVHSPGQMGKEKPAQLGTLKESYVQILEPKDGAVVPEEFTVKMAVFGMELRKAGDIKIGTGHHHLIINSEKIPESSPIPKDEKHIHFGDMQTETKLKLSKGKHTITLQFADGAHISYGPRLSHTIQVTVK